MEYLVQGTLKMDVALTVKSENERDAIQKAIELLNSYNIELDVISVPTEDGSVELEIHNTDIEWESCVEVEPEVHNEKRKSHQQIA